MTHTLSEKSTVAPSKRRFSRRTRQKYNKGEGAFFEDIQMTAGIGTHMDAPKYLFKEGKTVDEIPLSQCMAHGCVVHLGEKVGQEADYMVTEEDLIEWEEENGLIPEEAIVLIQTGWDQYSKDSKYCHKDKKGGCHFPGISSKAAELLVDRKVKGVGIDTAGIDPGMKSKAKAHRILLQGGIVVVEGLMNLQLLPPKGSYIFFIPMKIEGAPEAPIRAIGFVENV